MRVICQCLLVATILFLSGCQSKSNTFKVKLGSYGVKEDVSEYGLVPSLLQRLPFVYLEPVNPNAKKPTPISDEAMLAHIQSNQEPSGTKTKRYSQTWHKVSNGYVDWNGNRWTKTPFGWDYSGKDNPNHPPFLFDD